MNLDEFLLEMKIPQYQKVYSTAAGLVTLEHQKAKVFSKKLQTTSCFHTEYIIFLRILKENQGLKFMELYELAMAKYAFSDHAPFADRHLSMVESFARLGAVKIKDWPKGNNEGLFSFFGFPERSGDARFYINEHKTKKVNVLSCEPKYKSRERAFRYYFPKVL